MDLEALRSFHSSPEAAARAKARNRANWRLQAYGIAAIALATLFLVALLWSVFGRAYNAINEHYYVTGIVVPAAEFDPDGTATAEEISRGDFRGLVRGAIRADFDFVSGRSNRRALTGLLSDGAVDDLRDEAAAGVLALDVPMKRPLLLSDDADLYLRGYFGTLEAKPHTGTASVAVDGPAVEIQSTEADFALALKFVKQRLTTQAETLRVQAARQERGVSVVTERLATLDGPAAEEAQAQIDGFVAARDRLLAQAAQLDAQVGGADSARLSLDAQMPSFFVKAGDGIVKLTSVADDSAAGRVLTPVEPVQALAPADWQLLMMERPEAGRPVKDLPIALLETMRDAGQIERVANWRFLSTGDSREAELAGIWGAIVGSAWTMLVTFSLAFPIGVMAAIYLEEFAPKNWFTDFIEVNINNLAAVPSIVFGLLGLAVFLGFFGVPRSSPLAGGLVLALMTLPTVIIASRAAIRAVPPSIRIAALGLGASRVQTVFHHVLPLAMPGILTGTIIGMAQALGETAPLLLIGMVAFIVDIPGGITDSASVLPVQIFRWADLPERAFDIRTAAAIVVLLGFLVLMNLIAIILRKRFERRW